MLYVAVAAALAIFWSVGRLPKLLVAALLAASAFQLSWIYPYLPVAAEETEAAQARHAERRLNLMTANVLQSNRQDEKLQQIVREVQPDVLVLLEVDDWWVSQLKPLEREFAHAVTYPLDNTYGIAMYSNLPVTSAEVRFLVEPDIPSIDATVVLPSGDQVRLFAVHPTPPRPGDDTENRDAELVLVGREVERSAGPSVVLGDMNDVGWSSTTRLFQKVSRLLDPRKGRGMYSTYNAHYPGLRYPLDHLFHSDDFRLVHIAVLDGFGSDHFPLLVELSYEPQAEQTQEAPQPDAEDHERAQETLREAEVKP
jgi:endonuclease/exonuclease/phosphatase (EEP) superfamily protein YafD